MGKQERMWVSRDLKQSIQRLRQETNVPLTKITALVNNTADWNKIKNILESDKKRRKLGSLTDLPFLMVFIVVIALFLMFSFILWTPIFDSFTDVQEVSITANNTVSNRSFTLAQRTYEGFDLSIILLFVFLMFIALMVAYFINVHPVFYVFGFILLLGVIMMAYYLGDVASTMIGTDAMQVAETNFPLTTFLFAHFTLFMVLFGGLVTIFLFAKMRS